MERVTFAHTFSRDIEISKSDTAWLKAAIAEVEQGDMDAYYVARMAVAAGYLLIGTTVAKERHYPVVASQHRYRDLNARENRQYVPDGSKALRAGTCADTALMCGLFGDINSRRQRVERCKPYTGLSEGNCGWGLDIHKTFSQPLFPFEEAHVRPHARPELINACVTEPFTGYIECISGDETFERIDHEIGQYIGTRPHRTLLRIPLSGDIDLPADVLVTDYVSMLKTSA
jgi:hypothetical protein